jgi:hypothetical protein
MLNKLKAKVPDFKRHEYLMAMDVMGCLCVVGAFLLLWLGNQIGAIMIMLLAIWLGL